MRLCLGLFFINSFILSAAENVLCFLSVGNPNFQISYPGNPLVSGGEGNIHIWDKSFADQEIRKQSRKKPLKFDVEQIHKELREEEQKIRKGWSSATDNIVTATLTVFLQKDGCYYAITHQLKETITTHRQPTPRILAFTSGTTGRERADFVDANTYSISKLFQNTLRRLEKPFFSKNKNSLKIVEEVQKIQNRKKERVSQALLAARDILEMEEILHELDKLEILEGGYRKSDGYGPIADSEQFLLHYLETELIKEKIARSQSYTGLYVSILGQYVDDQYDYLRKKFSFNNYKEPDKVREVMGRRLEYSRDIVNYLPIGAMLHLHSTRELCEFCATSLVHEFYYENDEQKPNFANRLRQYMGQVLEDVVDENPHLKDYSPFFVVSASYNADDAVSEIGHELRPLGTISGKLTRPPQDGELTEDGLLNLNQIIENKALPLLPLG